MISALLLATVFEKIALVDSLDFAEVYDIETATGNVQVLEHVMRSHPTAIWWRDKGGGRMRYPSKAEGWPISEFPFDKRLIPEENMYGWLRLDSCGPEVFPLMADECVSRGLRFGVHTTWEENHWCVGFMSNWTVAHPEYWCCARDRKPWHGSCALAYQEVLEHKLELVDERTALGGDTVFLDMFRVGGWSPSLECVRPNVETWKRLYGDEPIPEDGTDLRWLKIVSRSVHGYLRRFSERCHAAGRRFIVGLPRFEPTDREIAKRFALNWKALAKEGVFDGIVVMNIVLDEKDPWGSTQKIYDHVMESRGTADIYFPVSMYDFHRSGIPSYVRATKCTPLEVARRLYEMAHATGARGVVMECVDYRNYDCVNAAFEPALTVKEAK